MSEEIKESIFARIQRYFFYGLLIILPVAATVFIVLTIIKFLAYPLNDLLGLNISPLLSFSLSLVMITMIGLLTSNFVGRFFVNFFESIIRRLPVIGKIYQSSKQVIAAFSLNQKGVMKPVMVQYPREGLWALGFLTATKVKGMITKEGDDFGLDKVTVYVPTTPNPTSGFYFYVNEKEVKYLNISVEEAIKRLMSAGFVAENKV